MAAIMATTNENGQGTGASKAQSRPWTGDPRRDPALHAKRGDGSREGWDPLVDGPMPEDGQRAWDLWDALRGAEPGSVGASHALERYLAWMTGPRGVQPAAPAEPIRDTLQRILQRKLAAGDPEGLETVEELIEQEDALRAKPPAPPVSTRPGKSPIGLYVQVSDTEPERLICEACAPKPHGGPAALAQNIYPVMDWWQLHPEEQGTCSKCGRTAR